MTTTASYDIEAGIGIYSIPEAARILRVTAGDAAPSAASLRRWVAGYRSAGERRHPMGELASWDIDGKRAFSFLALVEVHVVGLLREYGVSMRAIRRAREDLAERFGSPHPFATSKLLTDSRKILLQVDEDTLLRLDKTGIQEFSRIVEDFCSKVEFDDASDLAARIRPLGRKSGVVVDPEHAFGRPVIENTNLPTDTIYAYIKGGESVENVANFFELTVEQIEEAVEIETRMAA